MMKQSIKTILRNNFYMLRRIYRFRPSHFYITLFTTILGSITPVISLYLTRYILNTITAGTGEERLFSKVAFLIMLMGIYNLIVLVMNSWLQQRIIPKNTQVIHQKMQLEMFEKATEVELKCFEDAEFYDILCSL